MTILLTLGDGRVLANPTREVIEAALRTCEGGPGSFAIIEDDTGQSADLFLQGTGGPDYFAVEYAEAVAEHGDEIEARHFRGHQEVMQETLALMFESYALGDGTWKTMVAWEDTSTLPEDHYDEEYYDEDGPDDGLEGATSDPWGRRSGCLGLLPILALAAALTLTLALGAL